MSVTESDRSSLDTEWDAAFAQICDRHRGRLIRWLSAIFGPRDAEDIAQEALVRLFLRPGLLDPAGDPWPWLAVVARNVGRDMAKRNALSAAVDHLTLAEVPDECAVWDQVLARDDAERLVRALRALKPRDRALIRLRDVEDIPMNEVAGRLGVSENAARQQLFRARRRLAEAYTRLGGDRRLGLFPALGIRAREAFRRHTHALEPLWLSSPAVFAALLPCLVCAAGVIGGVLFPYGARGGGLALAGRGSTVLERDIGHGTGGRALPGGGDPSPGRPGTALPPHPGDPIVDVHRTVGPVAIDQTVPHSPLDPKEGDTINGGVWVDLPILGPTGVGAHGTSGGGRGPLCELLDCPIP
ncbi:MAG: polymerase sigma-70 factor, subfamily [Frankiaceae bacterium]|jgi:RNA polymerase sigma-70 factor (ECF subfamily)|nr:polymerase sigma-70 factor, subfamily [Frankiaceae bacterium]